MDGRVAAASYASKYREQTLDYRERRERERLEEREATKEFITALLGIMSSIKVLFQLLIHTDFQSET